MGLSMLGVCNRDCESILFIPLFSKEGLGEIWSIKKLLLNINNLWLNKIPLDPPFTKGEAKAIILSQPQYAPTVFFIVSTPIRNLCRYLRLKRVKKEYFHSLYRLSILHFSTLFKTDLDTYTTKALSL